MNKHRYDRLVAVIYIIGALFGIVLSLGGAIGLWVTKDKVTTQVTEIVSLMGRTLDATSATIAVVNNSLDQASTHLDLIHQMVTDTAATLEDTDGLITETSTMIGEDMVLFVQDTQESLRTVQTSARFIDDFLGVVSNIPFIGRRYQPEVTLQDSVAEVNKSLETLPESFGSIQRELDVTAANITTMQIEFTQLAERVKLIEEELNTANEVAEEYRTILTDVRTRWDVVEENMPAWLTTGYLAITALLIWIFINQVGTLFHGIALGSEE